MAGRSIRFPSRDNSVLTEPGLAASSSPREAMFEGRNRRHRSRIAPPSNTGRPASSLFISKVRSREHVDRTGRKIMIYRNSDLAAAHQWSADANPEAGHIAREFLTGELDLLRFTRTSNDITRDLSAFLDCAAGVALSVRRSPGGELLISAAPWNESLLLTGRTADVLRGYLDSEIV